MLDYVGCGFAEGRSFLPFLPPWTAERPGGYYIAQIHHSPPIQPPVGVLSSAHRLSLYADALWGGVSGG